ncbi:MAG: DUF6503 family protein [Flavobacteriaceae bacterium]|nr:DUF6503 family protein [Flavobacteriaceae bacterium]
MKKILLSLLILTSFVACKEKPQPLTVQQIVDQAIEKAGGDLYEKAHIEFDFRKIHYLSTRQGSKYSYERVQTDSTGRKIHDVLTNKGFERFINDSLVQVVDSMANKYANSVNSVHYFAYLPYGLNDKAVHKKLLGEKTIKGKTYYQIEVTFSEENGGDDHSDEFLYWINKETFLVDYLAYLYHTDEGGIRFREAFNPRAVNGIRLVDYKNYKPFSDDIDFYQIGELFDAGKLELLSEIVNENVTIKIVE